VVYALFTTLVTALNLQITVSIDVDKQELLTEFADFAKMVMCLDVDNLTRKQHTKVRRVGITNHNGGINIMENTIALIGIGATLVISIITFIQTRSIEKRARQTEKEIAELNSRSERENAEKGRHAEIISMRRKERIDNLILLYSNVVALTHPDTISAFFNGNDHAYTEKLLSNLSNFNMLLDHRFPYDTELAYATKSLVSKSMDYYKGHTSGTSNAEYREEYVSEISKTDKLLNMFIGTEWSRLREEVATGKRVPSEWWFNKYREDIKYYDKWDEEYNK